MQFNIPFTQYNGMWWNFSSAIISLCSQTYHPSNHPSVLYAHLIPFAPCINSLRECIYESLNTLSTFLSFFFCLLCCHLCCPYPTLRAAEFLDEEVNISFALGFQIIPSIIWHLNNASDHSNHRLLTDEHQIRVNWWAIGVSGRYITSPYCSSKSDLRGKWHVLLVSGIKNPHQSLWNDIFLMPVRPNSVYLRSNFCHLIILIHGYSRHYSSRCLAIFRGLFNHVSTPCPSQERFSVTLS